MASASARPISSRTESAVISPPREIHLSSMDSASLSAPPAARAIMPRASSSAFPPSASSTSRILSFISESPMRRKSNLWQRESTVAGSFCSSVVANMKTTCSGGSSRVLSKALNALRVSICTSSIIYTFRSARTGISATLSLRSRAFSTLLLLAASISIISGMLSARAALQFSHSRHGSPS